LNWCKVTGCLKEPHSVGYCTEHYPPLNRATGRFAKSLLRCLEAIEKHDLLTNDPEIERELYKIIERNSMSADRLSAIIVKRCQENPNYRWWFGTDSFCEICKERLYSEKFSKVSQEVKKICETHEICKKCNVVTLWDDFSEVGLCSRCDYHELWDFSQSGWLEMEEGAPPRPDISCSCGAKAHEGDFSWNRVRLDLVDFGEYSLYLCEQCHGEEHVHNWFYTNDE
jgi:hypothetical protein